MTPRTMAALTAVALVLSGCGTSPEEKPEQRNENAAGVARDVAMVARMNRVEARPILPQPFSKDDMARYDLARGCMFRLAGEDEAPVFVAQRERGYLKIDGDLEPLAAKGGSAELPGGARSIYVGLDHWIELVAQAGEGGDKQSWPSRLVIHDSQERVAYDKLGRVSCDT